MWGQYVARQYVTICLARELLRAKNLTKERACCGPYFDSSYPRLFA